MRRHIPGLLSIASLTVLTLSSSGCALFPESMQPQQLQKLNRGPGYSQDPFSSIPDKEATARAAALKTAFAPEDDLQEDTSAP